jgi:hypothetical protein
MNTSSNPSLRTSSQTVADVRAVIEQEFAWLQADQPRLLQLVLNEAEALAWQTGVAHLVFPLLAQEKVKAVAAWHARQKSIRQTEPILAFAV